MKITIFQSDKGDCLLLESADGRHILADGGMSNSYSEHVAPHLGKMREAGKKLDLVYLSHIDEDHIAGILRLMDDEAKWRVFEWQRENGNNRVKEPKSPRPPEVREIWHNAFHEQLKDNKGDIADMLAASANILAASALPDRVEVALENRNLAQSQRQAMQLARRVGSGQLNIPLNKPADGKLMFVRDDSKAFKFGKLSVKIIGPFKKELEVLRKQWNDWLRANKAFVKELKEKSREAERNMGNAAQELIRLLELRAEKFGNIKDVTPPNLASLMLLIEEKQPDDSIRKVILTGDGHSSHILEGLEHHGALNAEGRMHADVLKVQHHGAKANIDPEFCQRITADHYVFCGNGEHDNPEVEVVKLVLESRTGSAAKRSPNPEASNPFTLWFNNHSSLPGEASAQRSMKKVEELVAAAASSNNQVKAKFLKKSSFELEL